MTLATKTSYDQVKEVKPNLLYQSKLSLNSVKTINSRIVYGVLDLFSDIGGIFEFTFIFFGWIFFPLSKIQFYKAASEKLYPMPKNTVEIKSNL